MSRRVQFGNDDNPDDSDASDSSSVFQPPGEQANTPKSALKKKKSVLDIPDRIVESPSVIRARTIFELASSDDEGNKLVRPVVPPPGRRAYKHITVPDGQEGPVGQEEPVEQEGQEGSSRDVIRDNAAAAVRAAAAAAATTPSSDDPETDEEELRRIHKLSKKTNKEVVGKKEVIVKEKKKRDPREHADGIAGEILTSINRPNLMPVSVAPPREPTPEVIDLSDTEPELPTEKQNEQPEIMVDDVVARRVRSRVDSEGAIVLEDDDASVGGDNDVQALADGVGDVEIAPVASTSASSRPSTSHTLPSTPTSRPSTSQASTSTSRPYKSQILPSTSGPSTSRQSTSKASASTFIPTPRLSTSQTLPSTPTGRPSIAKASASTASTPGPTSSQKLPSSKPLPSTSQAAASTVPTPRPSTSQLISSTPTARPSIAKSSTARQVASLTVTKEQEKPVDDTQTKQGPVAARSAADAGDGKKEQKKKEGQKTAAEAPSTSALTSGNDDDKGKKKEDKTNEEKKIAEVPKKPAALRTSAGVDDGDKDKKEKEDKKKEEKKEEDKPSSSAMRQPRPTSPGPSASIRRQSTSPAQPVFKTPEVTVKKVAVNKTAEPSAQRQAAAASSAGGTTSPKRPSDDVFSDEGRRRAIAKGVKDFDDETQPPVPSTSAVASRQSGSLITAEQKKTEKTEEQAGEIPSSAETQPSLAAPVPSTSARRQPTSITDLSEKLMRRAEKIAERKKEESSGEPSMASTVPSTPVVTTRQSPVKPEQKKPEMTVKKTEESSSSAETQPKLSSPIPSTSAVTTRQSRSPAKTEKPESKKGGKSSGETQPRMPSPIPSTSTTTRPRSPSKQETKLESKKSDESSADAQPRMPSPVPSTSAMTARQSTSPFKEEVRLEINAEDSVAPRFASPAMPAPGSIRADYDTSPAIKKNIAEAVKKLRISLDKDKEEKLKAEKEAKVKEEKKEPSPEPSTSAMTTRQSRSPVKTETPSSSRRSEASDSRSPPKTAEKAEKTLRKVERRAKKADEPVTGGTSDSDTGDEETKKERKTMKKKRTAEKMLGEDEGVARILDSPLPSRRREARREDAPSSSRSADTSEERPVVRKIERRVKKADEPSDVAMSTGDSDAGDEEKTGKKDQKNTRKMSEVEALQADEGVKKMESTPLTSRRREVSRGTTPSLSRSRPVSRNTSEERTAATNIERKLKKAEEPSEVSMATDIGAGEEEKTRKRRIMSEAERLKADEGVRKMESTPLTSRRGAASRGGTPSTSRSRPVSRNPSEERFKKTEKVDETITVDMSDESSDSEASDAGAERESRKREQKKPTRMSETARLQSDEGVRKMTRSTTPTSRAAKEAALKKTGAPSTSRRSVSRETPGKAVEKSEDDAKEKNKEPRVDVASSSASSSMRGSIDRLKSPPSTSKRPVSPASRASTSRSPSKPRAEDNGDESAKKPKRATEVDNLVGDEMKGLKDMTESRGSSRGRSAHRDGKEPASSTLEPSGDESAKKKATRPTEVQKLEDESKYLKNLRESRRPIIKKSEPRDAESRDAVASPAEESRDDTPKPKKRVQSEVEGLVADEMVGNLLNSQSKRRTITRRTEPQDDEAEQPVESPAERSGDGTQRPKKKVQSEVEGIAGEDIVQRMNKRRSILRKSGDDGSEESDESSSEESADEAAKPKKKGPSEVEALNSEMIDKMNETPSTRRTIVRMEPSEKKVKEGAKAEREIGQSSGSVNDGLVDISKYPGYREKHKAWLAMDAKYHFPDDPPCSSAAAPSGQEKTNEGAEAQSQTGPSSSRAPLEGVIDITKHIAKIEERYKDDLAREHKYHDPKPGTSSAAHRGPAVRPGPDQDGPGISRMQADSPAPASSATTTDDESIDSSDETAVKKKRKPRRTEVDDLQDNEGSQRIQFDLVKKGGARRAKRAGDPGASSAEESADESVAEPPSGTGTPAAPPNAKKTKQERLEEGKKKTEEEEKKTPKHLTEAEKLEADEGIKRMLEESRKSSRPLPARHDRDEAESSRDATKESKDDESAKLNFSLADQFDAEEQGEEERRDAAIPVDPAAAEVWGQKRKAMEEEAKGQSKKKHHRSEADRLQADEGAARMNADVASSSSSFSRRSRGKSLREEDEGESSRDVSKERKADQIEKKEEEEERKKKKEEEEERKKKEEEERMEAERKMYAAEEAEEMRQQDLRAKKEEEERKALEEQAEKTEVAGDEEEEKAMKEAENTKRIEDAKRKAEESARKRQSIKSRDEEEKEKEERKRQVQREEEQKRKRDEEVRARRDEQARKLEAELKNPARSEPPGTSAASDSREPEEEAFEEPIRDVYRPLGDDQQHSDHDEQAFDMNEQLDDYNEGQFEPDEEDTAVHADEAGSSKTKAKAKAKGAKRAKKGVPTKIEAQGDEEVAARKTKRGRSRKLSEASNDDDYAPEEATPARKTRKRSEPRWNEPDEEYIPEEEKKARRGKSRSRGPSQARSRAASAVRGMTPATPDDGPSGEEDASPQEGTRKRKRLTQIEKLEGDEGVQIMKKSKDTRPQSRQKLYFLDDEEVSQEVYEEQLRDGRVKDGNLARNYHAKPPAVDPSLRQSTRMTRYPEVDVFDEERMKVKARAMAAGQPDMFKNKALCNYTYEPAFIDTECGREQIRQEKIEVRQLFADPSHVKHWKTLDEARAAMGLPMGSDDKETRSASKKTREPPKKKQKMIDIQDDEQPSTSGIAQRQRKTPAKKDSSKWTNMDIGDEEVTRNGHYSSDSDEAVSDGEEIFEGEERAQRKKADKKKRAVLAAKRFVEEAPELAEGLEDGFDFDGRKDEEELEEEAEPIENTIDDPDHLKAIAAARASWRVIDNEKEIFEDLPAPEVEPTPFAEALEKYLAPVPEVPVIPLSMPSEFSNGGHPIFVKYFNFVENNADGRLTGYSVKQTNVVKLALIACEQKLFEKDLLLYPEESTRKRMHEKYMIVTYLNNLRKVDDEIRAKKLKEDMRDPKVAKLYQAIERADFALGMKQIDSESAIYYVRGNEREEHAMKNIVVDKESADHPLFYKIITGIRQEFFISKSILSEDVLPARWVDAMKTWKDDWTDTIFSPFKIDKTHMHGFVRRTIREASIKRIDAALNHSSVMGPSKLDYPWSQTMAMLNHSVDFMIGHNKTSIQIQLEEEKTHRQNVERQRALQAQKELQRNEAPASPPPKKMRLTRAPTGRSRGRPRGSKNKIVRV